MLISVILSLATLVITKATPLQTRSVNVGWPYGSAKIRGVNIGGVRSLFKLVLILVAGAGTLHHRKPVLDLFLVQIHSSPLFLRTQAMTGL